MLNFKNILIIVVAATCLFVAGVVAEDVYFVPFIFERIPGDLWSRGFATFVVLWPIKIIFGFAIGVVVAAVLREGMPLVASLVAGILVSVADIAWSGYIVNAPMLGIEDLFTILAPYAWFAGAVLGGVTVYLINQERREATADLPEE